MGIYGWPHHHWKCIKLKEEAYAYIKFNRFLMKILRVSDTSYSLHAYWFFNEILQMSETFPKKVLQIGDICGSLGTSMLIFLHEIGTFSGNFHHHPELCIIVHIYFMLSPSSSIFTSITNISVFWMIAGCRSYCSLLILPSPPSLIPGLVFGNLLEISSNFVVNAYCFALSCFRSKYFFAQSPGTIWENSQNFVGEIVDHPQLCLVLLGSSYGIN